MAFATGEVIPTSGCNLPFKVVFAIGDEVTAEWPVESQEEGEQQIVAVLLRLRGIAESEGYV